MKNISIICPVLNEEEIIINFYNALKNEIKKINDYNFKIIFILDKSDDNTEGNLREIANKDRNTKVIIMRSKYGHQACLFAGLSHSKDCDAVIMMDSDLQHNPIYINSFLKKYEEGYHVVNAKRKFIKKNLKSLLSILFYKLLNIFFFKNIDENSPDFRLISEKAAKIIINEHKEKKIFFRTIIQNLQLKTSSIEYHEKDRLAGKSKFKFYNSLKLAENAFISSTNKPLSIIFYIGIFLSILSFIFLLFTLFSFVFYKNEIPPGWTTIVFLLCIFNAISFMGLGIVGRYIAAIFEEVKNKPIYSIDEIIN
jgi:dolichol-phosphate mannosyltransferase